MCAADGPARYPSPYKSWANLFIITGHRFSGAPVIFYGAVFTSLLAFENYEHKASAI